MKHVLKSIIFLFIFCLIWNYIFKLLWLPKNPIAFLYEEPSNSIDVIYIGSSEVDRSFNPLLAYDLHGFTTGILSTGMQPFIATKYLIEESRKSQNPSLYVIDIMQLYYDFDSSLTDSFIRQVTDEMKFSKNKIKLISEMLKYSSIDKSKYINYYLSFFMYHNNWKKIDESINRQNNYKGYYLIEHIDEIVPQQEYIWQYEFKDELNENKLQEKYNVLPNNNKLVLLDLIKYIKDNDLKVLFVVPKCVYHDSFQKRLNEAISIIEDNDLEIINMHTLEDTKIDFATDFYDENHLNVYGSTKYTLYMSKYLTNKYNLPNHKNDDKYKSWDKSYETFKVDFEKLLDNNFDNILYEYQKYYQ